MVVMVMMMGSKGKKDTARTPPNPHQVLVLDTLFININLSTNQKSLWRERKRERASGSQEPLKKRKAVAECNEILRPRRVRGRHNREIERETHTRTTSVACQTQSIKTYESNTSYTYPMVHHGQTQQRLSQTQQGKQKQ